MAPAKKTAEPTVTTATGITLPTGHRGAKVELPSRGRAATPSVYLADAEWSLAESIANRFETAWVAFQNVNDGTKQSLVNEWTKAARQLDCGLSKHVSEHPNGTVDVAFRCQPKRPKAANGTKTETAA
jgi:hypothetical protein